MEKWTRARYQPNIPLGENGKRVTACKEHIELSKEAAKEGMVLLKNQNSVLPLASGSKVALFGKGTIDYVKGGGGSGDVTVPYVRNIADGFAMLGDLVQIFSPTIDYYAKQVTENYSVGKLPGLLMEPELPDELVDKAAAFTDTAIISISRFSGEGWDRKCDHDMIKEHAGTDQSFLKMADAVFERGDYYLTPTEEKMIQKVVKQFRKVIVVLNVGGVVDTSWFANNDKIQAVLLAWQGGMEGGLAEAELIMGLGNPSGKLSDTFAKDLNDYPFVDHFYDSDDYVDYTEDIYVGYRYFETIPGAAERVVYPFGFGLSYTEFVYSAPVVNVTEDQISITTEVCNIGKTPGKEVIQAYYCAPQGKLGKPSKELAGYQKTKLLRPGETQRIRIIFSIDDMASYDDLGKVQKSAYVLEEGDYQFYIGTSIRDVQRADIVYHLSANRIVSQLEAKMTPTSLKHRMLSDGSLEDLPQEVPNDPNQNILRRLKETDMEFPAPAVRAEDSYQYYQEADTRKLSEVLEGTLSLERFVSQLPDSDLACLLGGQPNTGVANTFGYGNNKIYGIPNVMTADGPAGLRIGESCGVKTTAFPCATLLACTWNPDIVERIGVAGGKEVKENNISVWLTPAICIHRNPLCGRNFEYYSEDPLLTAKQAGAMVRGIQSNHIAATVKHLALNNKETNRKNSDSRASERAIREIYLKAFEIIVRESHPWSIMSSYNMINGKRASENRELLTDVVRGEWNYDGMITTDWWTFSEHYKETEAGNDVKMGTGYPERLLEAKQRGALTREAMETAAMHILQLILSVD